jgi:pimeloyl-ACP methyl ester carboxylesterase
VAEANDQRNPAPLDCTKGLALPSDKLPPDAPRLCVFSGFAIDERFVAAQRAIPGVRVQTPPWLEPRDGEPFREYALRMAEVVEQAGGPLYLAGASFGAMIALEAASVLRPSGVFIIAGGFSHRAIWRPLQLAGELAPLIPEWFLRGVRYFLPLGFRLAGPLHRTDRECLVTLFSDADVRFVRWGGPALLEWDWTGPLPCPVHHIHGERDPMVPLKKVRPDVVIPRAGHAINVTHPREVNAFIRERIFCAPRAADELDHGVTEPRR